MQTKTLVAALIGLFVLLVAFAWWVWFATHGFSVAIPLVATLLPPLVAITALLITRIQAGNGAQKLERAMREAPRVDSGEVRELQREFDDAVGALKRSKLGKGAGDGKDALFRLPWYVVIGPSASGKTTLLKNSGLQFPEIPGVGRGRIKVRGVGGTRNCDWFLTNRAVLLDTAGRWTSEDEDHDEWLAFLDLLKKHRGAHALNGLIAAINIDFIGSEDEDKVREEAAKMRERLDEVMGRLGVSLPIYWMITKCDLVRGFVDTFGHLSRSEREKIWGFTRPLTERLDDPARFVEDHFERICEALEAHALQRMPAETEPATLARIYEFPAQFRALQGKLSAFASTLFEDNVYQETPILRGVYFTSGTQGEGAVADLRDERLADRLKLRHLLPEIQVTTDPKAYFLADMLNTVVFQDQNIATASQSEIVRRHRRRALWTTCVFALSALIAVPSSFAYAWSSHMLSTTRQAVHAWQNAAPPTDAPVAALMLAPLDGEVRRYENGTPFFTGFGMYRGNEILGPLVSFYGRVLRASVVRPIVAADNHSMRQVMQQIQSVREAQQGAKSTVEAAQRKQLLEELQVQLLLAEQKGPGVPSVASRKAWLLEQLELRWSAVDPKGDAVLHKAVLGRYLDMLDRDATLAVRVDEDTIELARRALGGNSPAERALNALIVRFEPQDLDLRALAGDSISLKAEGKVPGAFTRESWEHVYRMIENGSVWDSVGEQWVLGGLGDSDTDQRIKAERSRALRAAYFDRYEQEWRRFLSSITAQAPNGSSQIEAFATELARADGPLTKLIANVAKNTKLEDPAARIEAKLPALPALPGAVAAAANALLPPPAGENPDLPKLATAFERFGAVSAELPQYQAQLKDVLASFTLSRSDPTQQAQLGDKLRSARNALSILITGLPDDWSTPIWTRVLQPPLFAFGDVVATQVRGDLEQLWCNALVRPFASQLGGRFPLVRSSKTDASLAALQGFLNPSGGILWQFYAQHIEGHIVTRQGESFVLSPGAEGVSYNRRLVDFLERAWKLQTVLFPGGAAPKVTFEVRVQGASDLRETRLSVGGKTVAYTNGPLTWQRLEWPGDQPAAGATLSVARNDERPVSPLREQGEWGLFHALGKAKIENGDPHGRSFTAGWDPPGGERVRIDFREVGNSNVLLELPLSTPLEPPSSITAGGSGCRAEANK